MKTYNIELLAKILLTILGSIIVAVILSAMLSKDVYAESKEVYESVGYEVDQSMFSDDELAPAEELLAWVDKWGPENEKIAGMVLDQYMETANTISVDDYAIMDNIVKSAIK